MEWKTDADAEDQEMTEEPYSSFKRGGSEMLGKRTRIPFIILGLGVVVLIVLFFMFTPRPPQKPDPHIQSLTYRINALEKRIAALEGFRAAAPETGQPSPAVSIDPLEYQQLTNWIKSNAEVISETIKKMDLLEKRLNEVQSHASAKTGGAPQAAVEKKQASEKKPSASFEEPVKAQPEPQPKVQPEGQPVEWRYHTVQKGENLYRISLKYGLTVKKLQELNRMGDRIEIQAGQRLVVGPVKAQ